MQRYRSLHMLMCSYDINCQYAKNLGRRLEAQFPPEAIAEFKSIESAKLPEDTRSGVGKYHLRMHTADCRPYFSLNYIPGVADDFGENCEQKWADIEGITRATKEMAPGHRHDRVNDQNSHANTKLVHSMGKMIPYRSCYLELTRKPADFLVDKHDVAEKRFEDAQAYFDSIETSINDPVMVAAWRKEHDEWEAKVVDVKNHRDMVNPFEIASDAGTYLVMSGGAIF